MAELSAKCAELRVELRRAQEELAGVRRERDEKQAVMREQVIQECATMACDRPSVFLR